MGTQKIEHYIQSVLSKEATTPAIANESNILHIISAVSGNQILSYVELTDINMNSIFIYDIPEDKKEFNIETVRKCISDIELRPYEWKNIFILRHFDTATIQAQNALLKALEECPEYAIILLEVSNTHSILETIQSRTIHLVDTEPKNNISTEWQAIINAYKAWDKKELAKLLYAFKSSSEEAIQILQWVYSYIPASKIKECDILIESLSVTHENPRSILDIFFI